MVRAGRGCREYLELLPLAILKFTFPLLPPLIARGAHLEEPIRPSCPPTSDCAQPMRMTQGGRSTRSYPLPHLLAPLALACQAKWAPMGRAGFIEEKLMAGLEVVGVRTGEQTYTRANTQKCNSLEVSGNSRLNEVAPENLWPSYQALTFAGVFALCPHQDVISLSLPKMKV